MGLGIAWLVEHLALRAAHAALVGLALTALVFAVGSQNLLTRHEWAHLYGKQLLDSIPKDSIVLIHGEPDLGALGYLHMIEGLRSDITLIQAEGVVLGNRLFHPLRTNPEGQKRQVQEMIRRASSPVVVTQWNADQYPRRDRWLYSLVDPKSADPKAYSIDVPGDVVGYFARSVLLEPPGDPWKGFMLGEMRRRFARLLAETLPRDKQPDEGARRLLAALEKDFHGSLGFVEGLMQNRKPYSAAQAAYFLEQAALLMPSDISKRLQARYFELRGHLRLGQNERAGALADFETALSLWPLKANGALEALEELYRAAGNDEAVRALKTRLKG
jgi:hypothetical protein